MSRIEFPIPTFPATADCTYQKRGTEEGYQLCPDDGGVRYTPPSHATPTPFLLSIESIIFFVVAWGRPQIKPSKRRCGRNSCVRRPGRGDSTRPPCATLAADPVITVVTSVMRREQGGRGRLRLRCRVQQRWNLLLVRGFQLGRGVGEGLIWI